MFEKIEKIYFSNDDDYVANSGNHGNHDSDPKYMHTAKLQEKRYSQLSH